MLMEDSLIYFPTSYPTGNWNTTGRGPCPIEDVYFKADDGVKTHGWFLKHPQSDKILVYYHGNAGSIADRYEWGCQLRDAGASVLMVEYRGYGRSGGKPGEEGFYRDAEAVWSWLTGTKGYTAKTIILYGKSLGGGVAVGLVAGLEAADQRIEGTSDLASAGGLLDSPWGRLAKQRRFPHELALALRQGPLQGV